MDTALISTMTQFISSVGFPIAIAGYMVVQMNKTMEENNKLLAKMNSLIETLIKERGDNNERN